MGIQGNTTKDTAFFYFDDLPLNYSRNSLQKWIGCIQIEGKQSVSVVK